ncbi:MAG: hypothetical protein Q7S29_03565 [Candidatus Peribacter sp.]|nr:hypothetical protein [Candidatus Peribacter sp.]
MPYSTFVCTPPFVWMIEIRRHRYPKEAESYAHALEVAVDTAPGEEDAGFAGYEGMAREDFCAEGKPGDCFSDGENQL